MGCYGFRLKVATTSSKNVEGYGHHHVIDLKVVHERRTRISISNRHKHGRFHLVANNSQTP